MTPEGLCTKCSATVVCKEHAVKHRHSWHYTGTFTRRCACGVTQRWGALTAWRNVPKLSAAQRRQEGGPR